MNSYDQCDEDRDKELSSFGRKVSGIFFSHIVNSEDEIHTAGHVGSRTDLGRHGGGIRRDQVSFGDRMVPGLFIKNTSETNESRSKN